MVSDCGLNCACMVGVFRVVSFVFARSLCRPLFLLLLGLLFLFCVLSVGARASGGSGYVRPSLCGVAVPVSVSLSVLCASDFVFVIVASLLLLLVCLDYSFGWPGCVFALLVCLFCSVGVVSLCSLLCFLWHLSALLWEPLGPLEGNMLTYPTLKNASH